MVKINNNEYKSLSKKEKCLYIDFGIISNIPEYALPERSQPQ